MKTSRWTTAGTGALLVLSTALTATAAPAAPTSASSSTSSSPRAPTPVKRVVRSYGAGPVNLDGQDARVSFHGEKGDIVHLEAGRQSRGSTTRLRLGSRKVPARWEEFWKLPRSGAYTFTFTAAPVDRTDRTLQLQKVRVVRTQLDAKPEPGRKEPRGYLNAVSVVLRDGDRALLTSKDYRHTMLAPGGHTAGLFGRDLQLEVGRAIHTTIGDLAGTELKAGSLIVVGRGARATGVTRSVVQPITTDGTVAQFTSDAQPREYVFTFDGAVGDVVIPDFHGTRSWDRVFQPPTRSRQEAAPLSGVLWFFDPGTARYSVITNGKSATTTRLSLTKALKGPSVESLDTPVTLTNTQPGQYVAVALPTYPSPTPVGLTATDAVFTTTDGTTPTWSVYLEPDAPYYCLAESHPPLGCGEYRPITIDQEHPAGSVQFGSGYTGNSLILAVPPTVSGQVKLTLQAPKPAGG